MPFGTLIGEPSFAGMDDETDSWTHRNEIFARTRERLKAKTTAEWLDILLPAGVWAGPVHGYAELVEDPQVRHNGSFIEYDNPSEGWVKTPDFPIPLSRTEQKSGVTGTRG